MESVMALNRIETDWKLKPNVECRVNLVKLKISPPSVQFHRKLDEETVDSHLNFILSALSDLSNIFHEYLEKCIVCDEYIQKLKDHIIQTHGGRSSVADSESGTTDDFTFQTPSPETENCSSVYQIPNDDKDDFSTDAYNSVTNPPVNHFSIIEQNLKEEEEQIVYEEDPLLEADDFLNANFVKDFSESDLVDGQSIEMPTNNPNPENQVTFKTIQEQLNFVLKCAMCDMHFPDSQSLTTHYKSMHPGKKTFKCYPCGLTLDSPTKLINHQQLIHTRVKIYNCDSCELTFGLKTSLTKHKKLHTGENEKPCNCEICGRGFMHMYHLTRHKLIHTQEKQFKCDICEKSFRSPYYLNYHKRAHTGDTPYSCDQCGKCFTQLFSLNRHRVTHTGVKPYECDLCGKKFGLTQNLRTHRLIHTGEKFKCETCGNCFSELSRLYGHIESIHGRQEAFSKDLEVK